MKTELLFSYILKSVTNISFIQIKISFYIQVAIYLFFLSFASLKANDKNRVCVFFDFFFLLWPI